MKLRLDWKKGCCYAVSAIVAISMLSMGQASVSGATLAELEAKREQLAKQTQNAMDAISDLQEKKLSVQEELDAMDEAMISVQNEYDAAKSDYDAITAQLNASQAQLDEATEKRDGQFENLSTRLKFLQQNGTIGYLDILMDSKDFSDLLLRMQYVNDIMSYDKQLLDELQATQDTIQEKTDEIAEAQAASEEVLNIQKEKYDSMDALVKQKQALLESYENDEAKYEQLIASNNRADQQIQQTIASLGSTSATSTYTGSGKFCWPVPSKPASSSSLSSGFVQRSNPVTGRWESHSGYDIPASYGANIVAAEAGTVIYSSWMSGYGYTIIIDHGGGITTLYGHNSSLVVSKGQTVSRGQTIAKCGSTGNSTGNHCHFSVLVNGNYVNPSSYLGVANVSY